MSLRVSETFQSFQGEGATVGKRAVFLRMQFCKLACSFCDTLEVWKKGKAYTEDDLLKLFRNEGYLSALHTGAHLILTGGDPMMQQDALAGFIIRLKAEGAVNHIEVETEGVIMPEAALSQHIMLWNVSPKLANSGMKESARYKPEVLRLHAKYLRSIFKFPVEKQTDLVEIKHIISECHIAHEQVYLMPVCDTRKSFETRAAYIAELAQKEGFNFSPRLHLTIWNKAVGV
jgi:organic radical activating enzyme